MSCSELARRIEDAVGERLEVRSLHEPQVYRWREEALGEDAPWAPTLIEVKGEEVRAWTGRSMGIALAKRLGPSATWWVVRALAGPDADPLAPVSTAPGLSRGQFLKSLGGVAVAMSVLSGIKTLSSPAAGKTQDFRSYQPNRAAKNRALEIFFDSDEHKRYSAMLEERSREMNIDQPAVARLPKNRSAPEISVKREDRRYDVREGWHLVAFEVPPNEVTESGNLGSVLTAYVNVKLSVVGAAYLQDFWELENGTIKVVSADLLGNRIEFVGNRNGQILRKKVLRSGSRPEEGFTRNLEAVGYTQTLSSESGGFTVQAQRCDTRCKCTLCNAVGSASCIPLCTAVGLAFTVIAAIGCQLFCIVGNAALCYNCG